MNKTDQLRRLAAEGFAIVGYRVRKGHELNDDTLTALLTSLKEGSDYALDGVVLDVNEDAVKARLEAGKTSSNLNPASAKKFKIGADDDTAVAKVVAVHWKASKDGRLKPRVEIEPTELSGVTITFATAHNAKNLLDKKIGPGALIRIVRSGDVIPYILETVKAGSAALPDSAVTGVYHWDENRVDFVLKEPEHNADVQFEKLVKSFSHTLGVEHISTKSLEKLFGAGYTKLEFVIKLNRQKAFEIIGSRIALKGMDSLKKKLNPIKLETLAAASGAYGRGFGRRRLAKIMKAHGTLFGLTLEQVKAVGGFNDITARQCLAGEAGLQRFLDEIEGYFTLNTEKETEKTMSNGTLNGQYFVFTGVRDKDLERKLEDAGAEVGSSTSKMTVLIAKDTERQTGKMKKAAAKGAQVISHAQALSLYG